MPVDPSAVFKKNENAAYRVYDHQATVVMPDRAEVKVLNEIGSLVWGMIDGHRNVRQVVDAVLETVVNAYQVSREEARRDILEFLEVLREHGMVS